MKTKPFALYDQNRHHHHIRSRIRNVKSAHTVKAFCQRLDAIDRASRAFHAGVLPLIGSTFGMTLRQYLQQLPPRKGLTKRVAASLGVAPSTLRKWANLTVPIPAHILIDLKRITQGQVTRVQ